MAASTRSAEKKCGGDEVLISTAFWEAYCRAGFAGFGSPDMAYWITLMITVAVPTLALVPVMKEPNP